MSTRERNLRIFGTAAVNGHRLARYCSRSGKDQRPYDQVMHECGEPGAPPNAWIYAAGFRVGWLAGWGT